MDVVEARKGIAVAVVRGIAAASGIVGTGTKTGARRHATGSGGMAAGTATGTKRANGVGTAAGRTSGSVEHEVLTRNSTEVALEEVCHCQAYLRVTERL